MNDSKEIADPIAEVIVSFASQLQTLQRELNVIKASQALDHDEEKVSAFASSRSFRHH